MTKRNLIFPECAEGESELVTGLSENVGNTVEDIIRDKTPHVAGKESSAGVLTVKEQESSKFSESS